MDGIMKITIIGAGKVGSALAKRFTGAGHQVIFGVRDPGKTIESNPAIVRSPVNDAIAAGDVTLLAVPFAALESMLPACGNFGGKILIDATNPITADRTGLTIGHDSSGAEKVAAWAAGARVVKAFSATGFDNMAQPDYRGQPLTMLYAGDDAAAKEVVARLIVDTGMEPVDAGPLRNARLLEPFAMVWIYLAYHGVGRDFAFQLVRR
jgi:8-hydroxy-5-deazaflavin:NADPH oxidoreductase